MKNNNAKSFVSIMLVIAISALVLRFAIDRLIKLTISQNESTAQETLKLIAASLESYVANNGAYPTDFSFLTQTSPAYLGKDYITESPLKGYSYNCSRLEPVGYSCSAIVTRCRLTGDTNYTITTGGLLVSEGCIKES